MIQKYPQSEYAENVKMSVEYLAAVKSGKPIPDNLQDRQMIMYVPNDHPIPTPGVPANRPKNNGLDMRDIFSNPSKILDQGKEAIKSQIEKIQNIDPSKALDSLKNKYANPDSLMKLNIQQSQSPDSTQMKHK
ncbi:MAG TPA: hypothetical protein DCW42_08675 [Bacteroidetes bacterium]|nr:hypothetical protein [Bacteroidota bacterium]